MWKRLYGTTASNDESHSFVSNSGWSADGDGSTLLLTCCASFIARPEAASGSSNFSSRGQRPYPGERDYLGGRQVLRFGYNACYGDGWGRLCNQTVVKDVPLSWNELYLLTINDDPEPCMPEWPPAPHSLRPARNYSELRIRTAGGWKRRPSDSRIDPSPRETDDAGRALVVLKNGERIQGIVISPGYVTKPFSLTCSRTAARPRGDDQAYEISWTLKRAEGLATLNDERLCQELKLLLFLLTPAYCSVAFAKDYCALNVRMLKPTREKTMLRIGRRVTRHLSILMSPRSAFTPHRGSGTTPTRAAFPSSQCILFDSGTARTAVKG